MVVNPKLNYRGTIHEDSQFNANNVMTKSHISDTSNEAKQVQLDLLRKMTGQERVNKAIAMSATVMRMSKNAIRRRHPEYSEEQVKLRFIELTYGKQLAEDVRQWLDARRQNGTR